MQKLQIYTQTELGPSIKFQITCEKCKYLQEQEWATGPNDCYDELGWKCLKLGKKLENLTTPFDCPLINIEKANSIFNAIENYVKV